MTLLNQIIAVESGLRSSAEKDLTRAYHEVQKDAPFGGVSRTYKPRQDGGDELPDESTRVQLTVEGIITDVTASLTRLFDVTFTKDVANTESTASVVVGERVLVADAPVPFLLFLEKKLQDIRTFIAKMPTNDLAEEWFVAANAGPGVWQSKPRESTRVVTVATPLVLAPATDRHPAQVQMVNEARIAGDWTTIKLSGRIQQSRQSELLQRVDRFSEAVKMAREKANSAEVDQKTVGADILAYIFE